MKVLGIDLSLTSTGLCIVQDGTLPKSLAVQTTSSQPWLTRVMTIECEATEWAQLADVVYIENYAFNSKYGREEAGELGGIVRMSLLRHGIKFTLVSPLQVKKFATGKGKVPPCPEGQPKTTWSKVWVQQAVKKLWGIEFKTDDETDAFVIAMIGYTTELVKAGTISIKNLPEYQQEVINDILEEEEVNGKNNTKSRSRKQSGKHRRGDSKKSGGEQVSRGNSSRGRSRKSGS